MKKRIKQRTTNARVHTGSPAVFQIPWAELEEHKHHFHNHVKFIAPGEVTAFLLQNCLPLIDSRKLKPAHAHEE
jgi:hypothetical protein